MMAFHYKLTSYSKFLHDLAPFLGAELNNNYLSVPEKIGTGFLTSFEFNEVDCLLYNFSLKENLMIKRFKEDNEFFTLVFDVFADADKFSLAIDQNILIEERVRNSAIYLTSFLYDTQYTFFENINLKGLRVRLTKEWMKKYLQLSGIEDVLEKYVSLKTENLWHKPVDVESKELLQLLLQKPTEENLLFYQNKIFRIVEIFFEWLHRESKDLHHISVSRNDIESAQKIENILTSETVVLPPTIKELARIAAMSESKLKKVFKTVYSLPIYEYFQKHRMLKAKMLLLSGNYSIKDVGYSLGYANLSNFTLAFKKEFGRLPSEVVKKSNKF